MLNSKKIIAISISAIIISTCVVVPTVIIQRNQEINNIIDTKPYTEPVPLVETITIHGIDLTFEVILWRDFMPSFPSFENGTGLIAVVYLLAENVERFPIENISSKRMWIIYQEEIWNVSFQFQEVGYPEPNSLWLWASGGPQWGPYVYVDVIVEIIYQNSTSYNIIGINHCIWRTD